MVRRSLSAARTARHRRQLLLLVLLLAAVVRLLALYQFRHVEGLYGDESYYVEIARAIARGEGHPGSFRPPLYPAMMAGVFALAGENLGVVRGVQILVSLGLVALVFHLVAGRFGGAAAFVSALGCALLPSLVHYSHFLWSEGLAAALLVAVFWALDRFDQLERRRWLVAAGLALGLLALVKEVWIYFVAVTALWLLWRQGSRWRRALPAAALFALCAVLPVLPWTVRNTLLHERPVLISTCRWFPVAVGNLLPRKDWLYGEGRGGRVRRMMPEGLGELEREAWWRQVALEAIRAEQPWWIVKKVVRNTGRLYSLHTQQVRFLESGWLRPGPLGGRLLLWTDVSFYLLITLPGLAALWWVAGGRPQALAAVAILFLTAVHVLANAIPRFHVPILPLFALYLGPLLVSGFLARPLPRWRRVGGWVTVALFAIVVMSRWHWALDGAFDALGGKPG